jgi:hypothetical protein
MQVRELVTRLGFEADTRSATRYEKTIQEVKSAARVAATAVAALGTAATGLVWQFTSASTETLSWANRLGIATDELQRLQFAAGKYSVTNEALIDGLKELSLRTDEFARGEGGQAEEAFDRLGLSAQELNRVAGDTSELFELVRGRISQVGDAASRQRIADELFGGQAGEQFTEFLGASADEIDRLRSLADDVGAVVPRDVLERAREFSRETGTLTSTIGGLGKVLAAELLPGYRNFVQWTQAWLRTNSELIRQNIRAFVERLSFAVETAVDAIASMARFIDRAVESTIGWDRATKLLTAVIYGLIATKLAQWMWGLAGAIATTVTRVGLLRAAFMALQRVKIVALLVLIGVAVEDLITWINGGESALGKWIGSWKEFKEEIKPILDLLEGIFTLDADKIMQAFDDLKQRLKEWAPGLRDILLSAYPEWLVNALTEVTRARLATQESIGNLATGAGNLLGGRSPSADMSGGRGGGRNQSINVNATANLSLPEGTSSQQRQYLEMEAEQIFTDLWDRQIRRSLWDFQPVEG